MSLFTEDDEKEVVDEVLEQRDGSESIDELVAMAREESGGQIHPETARRLLQNRDPQEKQQ